MIGWACNLSLWPINCFTAIFTPNACFIAVDILIYEITSRRESTSRPPAPATDSTLELALDIVLERERLAESFERVSHIITYKYINEVNSM